MGESRVQNAGQVIRVRYSSLVLLWCCSLNTEGLKNLSDLTLNLMVMWVNRMYSNLKSF